MSEKVKTNEENTTTEEFKLKAKDIKSIEVHDTNDGIMLRNVPVFKTGEYGGIKYDTDYIDNKIIKQFDAEEDIPFQADHSDSGKDTLGYIRNIKRNGEMAEADIELIDDNAIARWKKGLLKKFSVGIYTATGKLREISAVAFPRVKEAVVHSENIETKTTKKCPGCDTDMDDTKDLCDSCDTKKKDGDNKMAEEKKAEELLKEAAEMQTKMEAEKTELSTKLSEKDVEIKKLQETIRGTRIDGIVATLKSEGKILPAIEAKTKEIMLALDDVTLDKVVSLLSEVKVAVELGETAKQNSKKAEDVKKAWSEDHDAQACIDEAEKRAKANSTTYKEEYDKLFVA